MNLNNIESLIKKIDPLEFLTFLVSLIILSAIIIFLKNRNTDKEKTKYFFYGFYSIIFALFFTNIEELILPFFFNALEHISYLIASIFFLIGIIKYKAND